MGNYSFLQYPQASPAESDLWWLFRLKARQNDCDVYLSAAVREASAELGQNLLTKRLAERDIALSTAQGTAFADGEIEADRSLAEQAQQQGLDCLIGPMGLASSREAALRLKHFPQPQFSAIPDLQPWASRMREIDEPAMPAAMDRLFFDQPDRLSGVSDAVFAVIDGAKVFGLSEQLAGSGLRHACLFKGKAEAEWGDVAPWLVQLDRNHRLTRSLFTQSDAVENEHCLWQGGAAIFLRSPLSFEAMRAHLRHFTMVVDHDRNKRIYFRFYDPLTVRTIFADMPQKQLERFLSGVACLLAPDPHGSSVAIHNIAPEAGASQTPSA